ncbi:hypothetical protein [Synechococcus sp. WH 8016]|nr:hypothetical protein [Synechococcus sp. WH 8016]
MSSSISDQAKAQDLSRLMRRLFLGKSLQLTQLVEHQRCLEVLS